MVEYFGVLASSMERATSLAQLARAEGYVIDGERQIARQRKIIAQFEDAGADRCEAAKTARELLYSVELAQQGHIAHRDRLRSLVDQTDAERTINPVRYSANQVDR